jgi:hypothetical protein
MNRYRTKQRGRSLTVRNRHDATPVTKDFAYWLVQAMHILAVATPLGYVVNLLFLIMVFGHWELSAIQLVAPGDILGPGIALGVLLACVLMVALTPGMMLDPAVKSAPNSRRLHLLAGIVIVLAPFWLPYGVGPLEFRFAATLIALGCATYPLINIKAFGKQFKNASMIVRGSTLVVIAPALIWLLIILALAPTFFSQTGFAGNPTVAKEGDVPCAGKILWLGERAIIIKCSNPPGRIMLMTPSDGLVFHPRTSTTKEDRPQSS